MGILLFILSLIGKRKGASTPKGTKLGKIWVLKDAHGNVIKTFENKKEMKIWKKNVKKYL